jgi:hypothetical protein
LFTNSEMRRQFAEARTRDEILTILGAKTQRPAIPNHP